MTVFRNLLPLIAVVALNLCSYNAAAGGEEVGASPPTDATSAASEAAAPGSSSASAPAYTVQCPAGAGAAEQCQVDKDTYIGWRTFSAQCQVCQGGSGLGSTFAPNLLERLQQGVDHARFVEVVTNGFRGQVGAMPAWKGNPNVMPHVDQLYRYLQARAAGALPPGRPARRPCASGSPTLTTRWRSAIGLKNAG